MRFVVEDGEQQALFCEKLNGLTLFRFLLRLLLVVGIAWLLMIKAELMRGVWLYAVNGLLILRSDLLLIDGIIKLISVRCVEVEF